MIYKEISSSVYLGLIIASFGIIMIVGREASADLSVGFRKAVGLHFDKEMHPQRLAKRSLIIGLVFLVWGLLSAVDII